MVMQTITLYNREDMKKHLSKLSMLNLEEDGLP